MTLHATRKAIAIALNGTIPEEALLRSAKGELDQADVSVSVVEPVVPENRVSTEEALKSLKTLFILLEDSMIAMRRRSGKDLLIASEVADAFIEARQILQRGGCELVANRKAERLSFSRPTGA